MVELLEFGAFTMVAQVQSLAGELRPHTLCGAATPPHKTEQSQCPKSQLCAPAFHAPSKAITILASITIICFAYLNGIIYYVCFCLLLSLNITSVRFIHISGCSSNLFLFIVVFCYAATAKSLQSCPTLCDPVDGSPPGSPVPGIRQARTMERVAISFSNA